MSRDILIVGAGLAGLFLALKLAPRRVTVLSQAPLGTASSSAWAQGGLAAALAADDDPALHAEDTIKAGAGLVDPAIARLIAEQGPARVADLIALGVPFDRTPDGKLAQSLEAAHSRPRVVRVSGDLAGKAIMDALTQAARAASWASGPTRTINSSPTMPQHMWPRTINARPPNILRSVTTA